MDLSAKVQELVDFLAASAVDQFEFEAFLSAAVGALDTARRAQSVQNYHAKADLVLAQRAAAKGTTLDDLKRSISANLIAAGADASALQPGDLLTTVVIAPIADAVETKTVEASPVQVALASP